MTLFCQAGSSCKHLTLAHLLWFIHVQRELLVTTAAAGPSVPVLDEAVPREAGPRFMVPAPPTQSVLKHQMYKHPSLSQRPHLRAVTLPAPAFTGEGGCHSEFQGSFSSPVDLRLLLLGRHHLLEGK